MSPLQSPGERPNYYSYELDIEPADHSFIQKALTNIAVELRSERVPHLTSDQLRGIVPIRAMEASMGDFRTSPNLIDISIGSRRSVNSFEPTETLYDAGITFFAPGGRKPISLTTEIAVDGSKAAASQDFFTFDEQLAHRSRVGFDRLTKAIGQLTKNDFIVELGSPWQTYSFREALHYLLAELVPMSPEVSRQSVYLGGSIDMQLLTSEDIQTESQSIRDNESPSVAIEPYFYFSEQGARLQFNERPKRFESSVDLSTIATYEVADGNVKQQLRYGYEIGTNGRPSTFLDLFSNELSSAELLALSLKTKLDPQTLVATAIERLEHPQYN